MRRKDYRTYSGDRREYVREYMKTYNALYRQTHAQEIKAQRRARKWEAIQLKGGKCQRCGYKHCMAALSFHHRNPKEKERQIAGMFSWSWARILIELDKCDLLCANCHAEIHWEE